ncbi:hypothetical protein JW978_02860 [Candidatus Dojkabacteria bacterium]|nr:hypothetical protein [Candidatus Dojkabacteria bacterium]
MDNISKILIDDTILMDHLTKDYKDQPGPSELEFLASERRLENLYISLVTLQKLIKDAQTNSKRQEESILLLLAHLKTFNYTYEIALKAGEFKQLDFYTAALAATAITQDFHIATLKKKQYQGITDLKFINLKYQK